MEELFESLPMGVALLDLSDPNDVSRSTRMPVLEVKDGMGVEPDHVYVIPPNTTMTIYDHTLRLTAREETRGQHMAVDYFMRTLEEQHDERADHADTRTLADS